MTTKETAARLLRILSLETEPPGLQALNRLTAAFIVRVPFDNISKLLSLDGPEEERIPSFEKFVEDLEQRGIGGTCLTNNPYFCTLLRHLGYQAGLRGADMDKPNVHTCIGVKIGTKRFHIDVGYGAHLLEPIDLGGLPAVVRLGPRRYQFELNQKRLKLTVWDGHKRVHGYEVNPEPISPKNFQWAVKDSYLPESTFLNCLRIVKQTAHGMLSLTNKRLTEISAPGKVSKEFDTFAELEDYVGAELKMPGAPLREATEILAKRSGVTIFK